jgi:hypothetical protein
MTTLFRVARPQKIKKGKFGHKQCQKRPNSQMVKKAKTNKGQILKENLQKYIKIFLKYHKMLYVLLKFCQNRPKKILFSSRLKKAKIRPNGQILLFLENRFKKGQIRLIWPF